MLQAMTQLQPDIIILTETKLTSGMHYDLNKIKRDYQNYQMHHSSKPGSPTQSPSGGVITLIKNHYAHTITKPEVTPELAGHLVFRGGAPLGAPASTDEPTLATHSFLAVPPEPGEYLHVMLFCFHNIQQPKQPNAECPVGPSPPTSPGYGTTRRHAVAFPGRDRAPRHAHARADGNTGV